jgi:hypothetical protein
MGHRVPVVVARGQRPQQFVGWTPLPLQLTWVQMTCASFFPGPSKIVSSAPDRSEILRQSPDVDSSSVNDPSISRKRVKPLSGRITALVSYVDSLSLAGTMPMQLWLFLIVAYSAFFNRHTLSRPFERPTGTIILSRHSCSDFYSDNSSRSASVAASPEPQEPSTVKGAGKKATTGSADSEATHPMTTRQRASRAGGLRGESGQRATDTCVASGNHSGT